MLTKWKLDLLPHSPCSKHCSLATRPQHGCPARARPALQPSLLASWPPGITMATKHKHSEISWPFVDSPPQCPDRHLQGLSQVLPLPHPLRVGHVEHPPKAVPSSRHSATKSLAAGKGLAPFPSLGPESIKPRGKMQSPLLVWARGPQDPSTAHPAPCLALRSLA